MPVTLWDEHSTNSAEGTSKCVRKTKTSRLETELKIPLFLLLAFLKPISYCNSLSKDTQKARHTEDIATAEGHACHHSVISQMNTVPQPSSLNMPCPPFTVSMKTTASDEDVGQITALFCLIPSKGFPIDTVRSPSPHCHCQAG